MSEPQLEITTHISATPSTIWRFFTDPERFGRWMGAAQGIATIEARVGGSFRIDFPEFSQVISGELLELVEEKRFVISWGYEGELQDVPPGSSRVEFSLAACEAGSVLELRQSGLPSEEAAERHRAGFRLYASMLAAAAAKEQLGEAAETAVRAWFAAWKEIEPAKRRELLAACCDEEIVFRDEYAALRGIVGLDGHVATNQIVSRGIELQGGEALSRCHELVIFPWRCVVAESSVVATGRNVGRLGVDGRFVSVHCFRDATGEEAPEDGSVNAR